MKLNKQPTFSRKTLSYTFGALVLLILVAGGFYVASQLYSNSPESVSEPDTSTTDSAATKQQNIDNKENFINNVELPEQNSEPGSKRVDKSSVMSMNLSQENSEVIVSTKLPDFSEGTCDLAITNGSKTYSDSANILYQPSYSSCMGFNVPIAKLGGYGTWTISLEAKGSSAYGLITKNIEVKK